MTRLHKKASLMLAMALLWSVRQSYAQAPVITPKPAPVVLHLDASGNYNVQLSDVATITGNYNSVTLSPASFSCNDLGQQTVIVNAGNTTNNDPNSQLNYPYGIVCDASGNIYVADAGNNQVKKITPGGVVSVFAGSGALGSADGQGPAASFARPWGMTIDKQGNIFVADAGNNKIRKITPTGTVSTIAGSGGKGAKDGTALSATFNNPSGVAVDAAGNIYVVDSDNNLIRKVQPGGSVSTFAGNGQFGSVDGNGVNAGFYNPHGIAIDGSGNLYIADGNDRIRKISPNADVTTFAGFNSGNMDGTGPAASFYFVIGIAIDAQGNLYVAETGNNQIRKITPGAVVTTIAGNGAIGSVDGNGKNAVFNAPIGIALDSFGNLYVTDAPDNKIRKITPTADVTTLALVGSNGSNTESASLPVIVTVVSQPTITSVYNNITINTYPGCSPVLPDYAASAITADNCSVGSITVVQSPVAGTPLTPGVPQNVTLTATDAAGGVTSVSFLVTVNSSSGPLVSFNSNPTIFGGSNVQLSPQAGNDIVSFNWSPVDGLSDPSIKNPIARPSATTVYTLTVVSAGGCTGSARVTVTVLGQVVVPNAFTPNGDGINDLWNINNLNEYPACTVEVFNRGGQLVFHSLGYSKPWAGTYNGSYLPSGTYYYVIDLNDGRQKISGNVTLIR